MKVGAISATTRPTTIIRGNQSNWISAHRLNTTSCYATTRIRATQQRLHLAQSSGDAVHLDLGGSVHDVERHRRSRGYPDARLPGSPVADCRSRARVPV